MFLDFPKRRHENAVCMLLLFTMITSIIFLRNIISLILMTGKINSLKPDLLFNLRCYCFFSFLVICHKLICSIRGQCRHGDYRPTEVRTDPAIDISIISTKFILFEVLG